jgi:polyhydroxybutyrate depolymerase
VCRLNSKIAAFAAVSGSMLDNYYRDVIYGWGPCSPVHPTGMMLIPGSIDQNPHSTYEGLSYGDMPLYMSVNDITNYWSNYNNTDINPIVTDVVNSAPNDGSTVERKLWLNGDNCVSVQELKVVNGDHDWPGSFGNMDISASEEIWNFVSQFNLEGQIDCDQLSTHEIKDSTPNKELIQVIDVLGRKVVNHQNKNQILFYIYDDGSVEKFLK